MSDGVVRFCETVFLILVNFHRENGKDDSFSGDIDMENNKKGNIAIFNREVRSTLQNSTFIEDIYSNSDDGSDTDETVSRTQWDTLDESMANELSTLANCTLSNVNDTVDCDGIDDNDVEAKSNGFANDSVIVIDDD